MYKSEWPATMGILRSFTYFMLSDPACHICSDTIVKTAISTFQYIDRPAHDFLRYLPKI